MWSKIASFLLLTAIACQPTRGRAEEEPLRDKLHQQLNAARAQAGQEPVAIHPALSQIARDQAMAVAESGGTGSSSSYITATTRRLYQAGYAAHSWTEGSLIATSDEAILEQWRQARPQWHQDIISGDFEDVGIGLARFQGRPVVAMILALKTRTVEWRQAAPLSDLAQVRALVLATVNEVRTQHDRRPLHAESHLDDAAQRHAEDMLQRSFYDHVNPEGEGAWQRARAAGYRGARTVAENIAKGPFAPDEVVHRWMNSSGHRQNILRRGATEIGIGVAFGENENGFEIVWVQVFGSR